MAYSVDLRRRVVEFVLEGGSREEAARRFKVSRWCVYDWLKRETLEADKTGPKGAWKLDREKLEAVIASKPDATLEELSQEVGTGKTAVWHSLKKLKISRKKNVAVLRKKGRRA